MGRGGADVPARFDTAAAVAGRATPADGGRESDAPGSGAPLCDAGSRARGSAVREVAGVAPEYGGLSSAVESPAAGAAEREAASAEREAASAEREAAAACSTGAEAGNPSLAGPCNGPASRRVEHAPTGA